MTPGVIELKFSPRHPLVNFYLHTKFERDRKKMTELSNQKADERRINNNREKDRTIT